MGREIAQDFKTDLSSRVQPSVPFRRPAKLTWLSVRRHQLVRNSRQACDHYAKGYPAGTKNPRREGLKAPLILASIKIKQLTPKKHVCVHLKKHFVILSIVARF